MSGYIPICEKIARCDKAIKAKFGAKSGIRRAPEGHWEVVIFRGLCDYEVKGKHHDSPFAACKKAGVEVGA